MVYRIIILLIGLPFCLSGQSTITCVDESNNASVNCLSCADFDLASSKGLLVSDGVQDAFYHAPVKLVFASSRVTFISAHDEGAKSGRFLLSAFNSSYDTEAEIRVLLEDCGSVVPQTLSLSGRDLTISGANTVSLPVDDTGTDEQNLSHTSSGTNRTINIENGTGTTINIADNDDNSTNEEQNLTISGNQLTIDGATGNTITIPQDGTGTDNQQIESFVFDNSTSAITIVLEDGANGSASLANLADQLQLSGNSLSLVGRTGSIDLSPYLDNVDAQVLSASYDSIVSELSLTISGGNTVVVDINFAEQDPTVGQHIKDISVGDITNWDNDLVDDADSDPTNEMDSITITQTAAYNAIIGGAIEGGELEIIWELDSAMTAIVYGGGGGTDDQILSFNSGTYIVSLEDGGTIDLSVLNNSSIERVEITGTTASSITSSIPLFTTNRREVYLNGVMMRETATRAHTNDITITSTTITGYEAFEASDNIVIKSFGSN
jgi:hypothetical protein